MVQCFAGEHSQSERQTVHSEGRHHSLSLAHPAQDGSARVTLVSTKDSGDHTYVRTYVRTYIHTQCSCMRMKPPDKNLLASS